MNDAPARYRELARPDDSPEGEAARLFRDAAEPTPLSEARVELLWRSLRAQPRRKPYAKSRLVWLAAAALVTTGAFATLWQFARKAPEPGRAPATHASSTASAARSGSAPNDQKPDSPLIPQAATPSLSHSARVPSATPAPDEPGPGRETESALLQESKLLGAAMDALRQQRNPKQALRLLDEHRSRFPAGKLATEVAVVRVDALLATGARAEALKTLDSLPLARLPRAAELRVLRAELRSGLGRCAEAIPDFDATLVSGESAALIGRALFGRASCHSQLGQKALARRDLTEYLRRFPQGAYADRSRAALSQ